MSSHAIATDGAESHRLYIGGKWVESDSGEYADDLNPYTEELYARTAKANVKDADKAMEAAYQARGGWAATPPAGRAQLLLKAAQLLQERRDEFAGVLIGEGGGTFGKAMFEIAQTVDLLQTAAGDAKHILGKSFHTDPSRLSISIRKPRGTVVAISPWNFPLILSMYKVAYALATGNTVVFKPASDTPVIGVKIAELFDHAGVPAGVLNVLTGPGSVLGDALIEDERCSFVAITGETETGRHVAQTAAKHLKEYTLELGGKNPLIILKDADVDYAVDTAAFGTFMHQGQICMSVGRIIVEDPIADEFTEKLAKKARSLSYGDPSQPTTVVGPLINRAAVAKVERLVRDAERKGAEVLTGGTFDGNVYLPTVLAPVRPEMEIFYEETFGPVASIIAVKDEEAALHVANDTTFGLSSAVVTNDLAKALYVAERLEAGMVHVNNAPVDADASCPFGGVKWSGQGREGGQHSIDELTEVSWVTMEKQKKQYPF
ncbi:MAG: aldehyde dehydrogenase family protein [Spirochaetota bacterium]